MIVVRLIASLLDLVLLPLRLALRGRLVRPGSWLRVTIDGPVLDVVGKARFWQVRAQRATSIHMLDELVTVMASDERVRGMLVTIRSMGGGMATATSLRSVLARARAAGKEVAVHLPMGAGSKEVYVATAATKVFLGPTAQLSPLGFRSASRYIKPMLDRAGVEPQIFACGEFKSAGENLVRDSMSPEQRAQLERLYETFHEQLLHGISDGRGVSRERAAEIVDQAPYFGRAAVDAGLADDLAYDDEVMGKLDRVSPASATGTGTGTDTAGKGEGEGEGRAHRKKSLRTRSSKVVDGEAYLAGKKRPLLRPLLRRPVVAVIPVHGAITHAGGMFGGLSTDERVGRMIRVARRDPRVRGVILHVDSPGGSALASDLMHHEIVQLTREKPVVVCMANVAASGGYYVAAPAACIVAQPTTVTGSIGVVAARVSLEPLLHRLGVREEVIEKGARASLLSPMGVLDEDDRSALMRELLATYRAFVGVVASGRKMSEEEVERLARGRVYTGRDAADAGLVDRLGGFDVALAEIRRRLPADVGARAEVVVLRTPKNRIPVLDPPTKEDAVAHLSLSGREAIGAVLAALLPARERLLIELATKGERVLAIGPIAET